MGITIEEAIDVVEYLKTQNPQLLSLDIALEIMRKYQNIKQIIEDHDAEIIPEDYDNWYINKIREVVEDGKID